jgi:hypothetical protein
MTEKVIKGSTIIYSLVSMKENDISLLNECDSRHHEIAGYILYDTKEEVYKFYSVEDNYVNPIVNHWTSPIVKNYDNEVCWILIKQHPCKLYSIITDMYKNNLVCNVYNFDIWKSDIKNCLVGVVTDIEID